MSHGATGYSRLLSSCSGPNGSSMQPSVRKLSLAGFVVLTCIRIDEQHMQTSEAASEI